MWANLTQHAGNHGTPNALFRGACRLRLSYLWHTQRTCCPFFLPTSGQPSRSATLSHHCQALRASAGTVGLDHSNAFAADVDPVSSVPVAGGNRCLHPLRRRLHTTTLHNGREPGGARAVALRQGGAAQRCQRLGELDGPDAGRPGDAVRPWNDGSGSVCRCDAHIRLIVSRLASYGTASWRAAAGRPLTPPRLLPLLVVCPAAEFYEEAVKEAAGPEGLTGLLMVFPKYALHVVEGTTDITAPLLRHCQLLQERCVPVRACSYIQGRMPAEQCMPRWAVGSVAESLALSLAVFRRRPAEMGDVCVAAHLLVGCCRNEIDAARVLLTRQLLERSFGTHSYTVLNLASKVVEYKTSDPLETVVAECILSTSSISAMLRALPPVGSTRAACCRCLPWDPASAVWRAVALTRVAFWPVCVSIVLHLLETGSAPCLPPCGVAAPAPRPTAPVPRDAG